jgi:CDGSH-type Zn-finger protein
MSDDHGTGKATIKPRDNGPYRVDGLRLLVGADGNPIRVEGRGKGNIALCRCGASESKPFCDGSHRTVGFDTAPPPVGEAPAGFAGAADRATPVGTAMITPAGRGEGVEHARGADRGEEGEIRITAGGPYVVIGSIELTATEWPEERSRERYTLCRCGHSASKPFCDGSHARVGFDDPGLDTTINGER